MTHDDLAARDPCEPLRGFIDRVVVPALLERFLRGMRRADTSAERTHKALLSDVLASEVWP